MSIAQADLMKAINTVWDASTLDALFKALWNAAALSGEFPVLNESQGGGEQPFPHCVFEMSAGNTSDRMSGGVNAIREVRDVPVNFRVHTRTRDGDARTAKEIAAYLVEEIMKVFGGHPTQAPTAMTLDNGKHLITTYDNDYSIREEEDNYQWVLSYIFKVDIPVMSTSV